MPDTVHCDTHGETQQTFACSHLAAFSHGLGFNCDERTGEERFPDAWCDDCEVIRAAHDGWTDEAQELVQIKLLCSGCYERTRIRNTKPTVTLDDLADLRWKCGSCEEWHTGAMLDVGFDQPHYWSSKYDRGYRWSLLPSGGLEKTCRTFLDSDYCAIDDEQFYVRGIVQLPILGAGEDFCWGVWGSLSRENFEALIRADAENKQPERTKMFSWLSSSLSDYPDTLSLKMDEVIQEGGMRPHFHLERTDHPLAKEFYEGITPERVKEIMFRALPPQPE
jgi:hypothetical protein